MFAVIVSGAAFLPGAVIAQPNSLKDQLVGTWMMLSARNIKADGGSDHIFGPNGKGILIFQQNGRFVFVLLNPDVPKFASSNRIVATSEELKAAYQGGFASFGRYSVDEADRSFVFHFEYGTFPNYNGTDQKRYVKAISADEFEIRSEATPIGGVSEFRLRRDN
jgi:Lipocalin-like domain